MPILLVLASIGAMGAVTVLHSDAMSPIDEWVYIDYLDKLPEQGAVVQGEEIGRSALGRMACAGVVKYGAQGPTCGSDYSDPSKFPFGGITSADIYTPIYFVITWALGGLIHVATGVEQLVAWRLTGALWLGAGMVAFYALLRLWRIPNLAIMAVGMAAIASPFTWWANSYVSTDAPAFLMGSLLLLATEKFLRGHWPAWWVPVLAVFTVALKFTFIVIVCLVALYLLIRWVADLQLARSTATSNRISSWLRAKSWLPLGIGVISLVTALTSYWLWNVVRSRMAVGPPANQGNLGTLGKLDLVEEMASFLPGAIGTNTHFAAGYALDIPAVLVEPFSWICIAGVIGALFIFRVTDADYPLVLSVALSSLLLAPVLAIAIFLSAGGYFPLPPRYGGPLLPAFLLLTAMILKGRLARLIVLVYAIAMVAVIVVGAFQARTA